MFGYLFARLWKNLVARIVFLLAIILVSFSLIYNARQNLYQYFSRAFSSPDWSDVATHGSRPFAFEENESKAQNLTESAWREIHALAVKKLGIKDAKETIARTVTRRPYSTFLNKSAEEDIFVFLNALKANCGTLITPTGIAKNTNTVADLEVENSATGKMHHALKTHMNDLLKIEALQVEAALQKKPDYLPAIELSEEIFRATCSVREVPPLIARAIDYREYFLQKQLYSADNGRLYEKNPELFHVKSGEAYGKDPAYRELFIRYFETTKYRTPYNPAHLKNMRNAYATLQNVKSLEALIAALLAEARNETPLVARKCHFELFALDYPGISERTDYLYALAETAVRGEEFARATNIIANALKSSYIKDETVQRDLERLRFHLNLLRHDSENLSRF
jgi:hypothetical protein